MKFAISLVLLMTTLCFCVSNDSLASAQPLTVSKPCVDIDVIFARGSGQTSKDKESARFRTQLQERVPPDLLNYYELGTETYGDKYEAIDVESFITKIGALVSAGHGYAYGESVLSGVTELLAYITQRHQKCPDSHFVLAGYSQGAQVVGQTLPAIPQETRDRINFVALFGDPKLYLPEGVGFNPPACSNEGFSPWRRSIEDCRLDNGSLGSRKPYLPNDMKNKTGLWCVEEDLICGTTYNILSDGHGTYANEDGPIDHAAREIAQRLQPILPDDTQINTEPIGGEESFTGPDVVILVDDQALDTNYNLYNSTVEKVDTIARQTLAADGRVGLRTYDACNLSGLGVGIRLEDGSTDISQHLPFIQYPNLPCDSSALMVNQVENIKQYAHWRIGADKTIVIITPSAYRGQIVIEPSLYFGTVSNLSPRLATTTDSKQFHIYPIVPDDISDSFTDFHSDDAEITIIDDSQIDDLISENTRHLWLAARLTSQDYRAFPGDDLKFDASPSLVHDDEIVKYEWFFGKQVKGVPVPSITGTSPIVHYTYDSTFDGTMSVRITTASGLTDTVTADVLIRDPATIPPMAKAPVNLQVARVSATSAKITWDAADDLATSWLVSLNGFPLGRVAKDQHFLTITDLLTDQANTFSVRPIVLSGERGEAARVTLQPSTVQHPLENFFTDPTSNPQHPAATLVAAVTKLLDLDTKKATGTPATSDAAPSTTLHEQQKVAQPSLLLYVIGGVIACGLTGLAGWFAYKKLLTK